MVKTKYQCEWPGCEKIYNLKEEAQKCESKRVIGPEIKPGLIVKLNSSPNCYLIFVKSREHAHEKEYICLELLGEITSEYLRVETKIKKLDDFDHYFFRSTSLLTEEEFKKMKRDIQCEKFSETRRRNTELFKNLYQEHPLFQGPSFFQE